MRLPREISPAAASRRSFLADVVIALVLAVLAIVLAAGIGIVGIGAVLTLLALLVWFGIEAVAVRLKRRHRRRASAPEVGGQRRSDAS